MANIWSEEGGLKLGTVTAKIVIDTDTLVMLAVIACLPVLIVQLFKN